MNERRFKIGMISKHVYASWGKKILGELVKELPEGTVVLEQEGNFSRACLDMLLYNPKFEVVPLGQEVPRVVIDIKVNPTPPKKLVYNH